MYSAYKLNKQGDSIQPWRTPFPIWNQSVVPCPVLTVASWPAYRFLKRQIRWSGIPISQNFPQFIVIHTVKDFVIVNEAEIDVFLELSCFFRWSSGYWQLSSHYYTHFPQDAHKSGVTSQDSRAGEPWKQDLNSDLSGFKMKFFSLLGYATPSKDPNSAFPKLIWLSRLNASLRRTLSCPLHPIKVSHSFNLVLLTKCPRQ